MRRITVAEAVILTGRSKSAIYRLIETGELRADESTAGYVIDLDQARRVLAKPRRGRPKGSSRHAA